MSIDVCSETQTTVCELNNRLIHVDRDSDAQAPGLSYPVIHVPAQRREEQEYYENEHVRQLPILVRGTGGHARWLGANEDVARPSLVGWATQQVASRLWPLAWPVIVARKWLMGYGFELVPGASSLPSAMAAGTMPLPPPGMPPALVWHPHRSMLAAADAYNRVVIHDMTSVEQGLGGGTLRNGSRSLLAAAADARADQVLGASGSSLPRVGPGEALVAPQAPRPAQPPPPLFVLEHPAQPQVHCLAWRPNSGACLAVGARGLVCLWALSGSGPASLKPPVSARFSAAATVAAPIARGGRSGGPWLSVLRVADSHARLSALAWSPDGRLLAAASPDMPGVTLWDVASGERHVVGVGLAAISLLRWSPCGSYLFGAGVGPRFHVWETNSWMAASWDAPLDAGAVAEAAWAPTAAADEVAGAPQQHQHQQRRVLLLSFERGAKGGRHLVALHFVDKPPSLDAMLMPMVLQDVVRQEGPSTGANGAEARQEDHPSRPDDGKDAGPSRSVIGHWAWDPTGERLAVLMVPPHPLAGCLALYAISLDTVIHARLLGFARLPLDTSRFARGAARGRVVAHGAFARGALFSLRLGGADNVVCNLPMYFK